MYTVYINDCPLRLSRERGPSAPELSLRYTGKSKHLLQLSDTLEGGKHPEGALIYADDVEGLWRDFQSLYRSLPAAGGVVCRKDYVLLIYRRGSWDLPKGKIDSGETHREAALREVCEETGLCKLTIAEDLPTSYHTYRHPKSGDRILKPTYWYRMSTDEIEVTPETEEDIERAEWVETQNLSKYLPKVYANLRPVLQAAFPDELP